MTLRLVAATCLVLVATLPSPAVQSPFKGQRDEVLQLCDEAHDRGRQAESTICYERLASSMNPAVRGEALWMLGRLKDANVAFREAVKAQPENPDLRVRWGYLYIHSHQPQEAEQLFHEALEIDKDHVPARLGLVRVLGGRFDSKAAEMVRKVLEDHPRQAEGHILLGRMALEEGNRTDARMSLESALEQANSLGVSPLEAYSLLASLEMLEGEPDNQWVTKAMAHNPRSGLVYLEQAHFYVITRRYREAIERLEKAVSTEPQLWTAHAELGINLLREGRDAEGRRHLELSYNGDPFSAKTTNTLKLLDTYDKFETFVVENPQRPDLPSAVLKMGEAEAPWLHSYASELTSKALSTFTEKYEFVLPRTVRVEVYPNHDDFAVRTTAMPGIGLLGVAFGYVVAMDGPTGRPPGEFHWGTTLWHELAHVFTLESTNHLVPRWFSEGISMYEEWMADPRWGESVGPEFVEALRDDKLLPIAELDRGFIRPRFAGQVAISYMQAGFVCRFIAETWGFPKLVEMLQGFADDRPTDESVETVLGLEPEAFDKRFETYMHTTLGPVVDGLGRWRKLLKEALEAARDDDWPEAVEPATSAKEVYPQFVGSGSPYVLLANAADKAGDRSTAIAELQEYERRGGRNPEMLKKLAGWLEEADRLDEAAYTYDGLIYNFPQDEEIHVRLGELLLDLNRAESAAREFQTVLAMEPLDVAATQFGLARAYVKMGDLAAARTHVLRSLERAPTYRPALKLLQQVNR